MDFILIFNWTKPLSTARKSRFFCFLGASAAALTQFDYVFSENGLVAHKAGTLIAEQVFALVLMRPCKVDINRCYVTLGPAALTLSASRRV